MEGCLVTCNSDSACAGFWVNWGSCHMVNKTRCSDADASLRRWAAEEVTYFVKL